MTQMGYVLGVDGGNTKTIALIASLDGTILGWGRGGCSDIYGAGSPEAALEQIKIAVAAALDQAGLRSSGLSTACFSLAGADWPEDFTFLRTELAGYGYGERIEVVNDALGALRAGSPDGTGVVVVCGTGAAVGARSSIGRIWHSSFWQGPQGAVELGKKTLLAIYRAALGLEVPTTLTGRVLDVFQLTNTEQVLHLMTSRLLPHPSGPEIGQLARLLLDEALQGDAVARSIVETHGAALGEYALVAARRVGIDNQPFTLVLNGGVLRHESRVLADAVINQVRQVCSDVQPIFSPFEPAIGAFFMALEMASQPVDANLRARVKKTLPPDSLFVT
jgi:N-acetylglucosamine kinase-like BadF-type ATPase